MLDLSEKRLNKTIFHLAWPAILESLLQMTIFVTDSIMIGPLGTHAFAAVGQGSMMASYMIFPLWSLGTATSAVVARYIGAQDMKSARKGAGQGIFLAILIGLVYTCAGVYFAGDFLILIGTPQEIAQSSGVYLAILFGVLLLSSHPVGRQQYFTGNRRYTNPDVGDGRYECVQYSRQLGIDIRHRTVSKNGSSRCCAGIRAFVCDQRLHRNVEIDA